ncbi:MAG: hypothetical protein K2L77_05375 [Muribaculaceae bacterium]|nr:hypothetical protein [Muribaculaceae bacterium]
MTRRLIDIIAGLILPRQCDICRRDLLQGEHILCMHCLAALPTCHEPEADLRASRITRHAPVARVATWLSYTRHNTAATLIRRGKYNGRPDIFATLGKILAGRLARAGTLSGIDALIPVPMHWYKRLRRGYNQAAILAQAISAATGIPVLHGAVTATRSTPQQAGSSAQARADNSHQRFRATRSLQGMHIAIVDDILTTGATISGVIEALAQSRPQAISIITLAAAPSPA